MTSHTCCGFRFSLSHFWGPFRRGFCTYVDKLLEIIWSWFGNLQLVMCPATRCSPFGAFCVRHAIVCNKRPCWLTCQFAHICSSHCVFVAVHAICTESPAQKLAVDLLQLHWSCSNYHHNCTLLQLALCGCVGR